MAIFLFLSGYGINESFRTKGLSNYWWKKIIRVFVPYLIWCILLAITIWILPYDSPAFRRYWYLEYLFIWYASFWITKRIFPQYAVPIMIFLSMCFFPIMENLQTEQSFSFLLGVFASEKKTQLNRLNKSKWIMYAFFMMIWGMVLLYLKQMPAIRVYGEESIVMKLVQLGIKLPIGLSIIIIVSGLYSNNLFWRVWGVIGIVSLELYLVQMPFPKYIQGNYTNLFQISILVALLSFILHFISQRVNTLLEQWRLVQESKV